MNIDTPFGIANDTGKGKLSHESDEEEFSDEDFDDAGDHEGTEGFAVSGDVAKLQQSML